LKEQKTAKRKRTRGQKGSGPGRVAFYSRLEVWKSKKGWWQRAKKLPLCGGHRQLVAKPGEGGNLKWTGKKQGAMGTNRKKLAGAKGKAKKNYLKKCRNGFWVCLLGQKVMNDGEDTRPVFQIENQPISQKYPPGIEKKTAKNARAGNQGGTLLSRRGNGKRRGISTLKFFTSVQQ